MIAKEKKWYVYLLVCSDMTLYCGITTDIGRRLVEHNQSKKGAKYTRSRRPVELVGYVEKNSRSEALSYEIKIKKLKRKEKILMFIQ